MVGVRNFIGIGGLAVLAAAWVLWPRQVSELAFSADLARDLREESPFMVGDQTYRGYYLGRDAISKSIQRRYGTWPFDLPSAAACLTGPVAQGGRLAWGKLGAPEALEVCLARVLNQFSAPEAAMSWLAAQGLQANGHADSAELGGGSTYWFEWSPQRKGAPEALWAALPEGVKVDLTGLTVMVEICNLSMPCKQLQDPAAQPPFLRATVGTSSKYEK